MVEDDEIIKFYTVRRTLIFWNVDEYPVAEGTNNLVTFRSNIDEAFDRMGFYGISSIYAHSSTEKEASEGIYYFTNFTKTYRKFGTMPTLDMTSYMLDMAKYIQCGSSGCNMVVIAKPSRELVRVMQCLKSRGHIVLHIQPPPYEDCLFSVDSLVDNARLLGGGKPRCNFELTDDDYYDCEPHEGDTILPSNKIVDFSEPVCHMKEQSTLIFWDAVDCPFPPCLTTPDEMYAKIKTALLEKSVSLSPNISIWAYVDESNEYLVGDKTWDSRIYFLPGGSSRRVRMLNDMILMSRDSPPSDYDGCFILVSDHFRSDPCYTEMFADLENHKGYFTYMLVPSEHVNLSESPDWPLPLFRRAYSFGPETETDTDEGPKKHKAEETPDPGPWY